MFMICSLRNVISTMALLVNRAAFVDKLKRFFKGSQAIESIRVLSSLKGVQRKAATQTICGENSHSVLELSGKVYRSDLLQ